MNVPGRRVKSIVEAAAKSNLNMDYYANLSADEIRGHQFVLISFEYAVSEKGKYYPCEMGVLKFSLSNGIIDTYHTFVSPSPLPTGSSAAAKMHSTETHQLPIIGSGFPYWDDDFSGMLAIINEMAPETPGFLFGVGCTDMRNAPPGAKESSFGETHGCYSYLIERAKDVPREFKLFPAEQLAKIMVQKLGISRGNEASKLALQYLQREKHNFDPGVRCFFHELELESLRCALASVCRFYLNLIDLVYEPRGMKADIRLLRVPEHLMSRMPQLESKDPKTKAAEPDQKFEADMSIKNQSQISPCAGHNVLPPLSNPACTKAEQHSDTQEPQDFRLHLKRITGPLSQEAIVPIGQSKITEEFGVVSPKGQRMVETENNLLQAVAPIPIATEPAGIDGRGDRNKARMDLEQLLEQELSGRSFGTISAATEQADGGSRRTRNRSGSSTCSNISALSQKAVCGDDFVSTATSVDSILCAEIEAEFNEEEWAMSNPNRPPTVIARAATGAGGFIPIQQQVMPPPVNTQTPSTQPIKPPDPSNLPMPPLEWLSSECQRRMLNSELTPSLQHEQRRPFLATGVGRGNPTYNPSAGNGRW